MTPDDEVDRLIRDGARARTPVGICVEAERLAAFYRDELAETDADAVRAHLATCPICLEAARDARLFVAAMGESRRRGPRAAWQGRRLAIAAALAGIGLVAGGLYVARRITRPAPAGADVAIAVVPAPYEPGPDELVWRGEGGSPLERAMGRYRAGDYRGAVDDLTAYVAAHPDDARGRFYLGVARLLAGNPSLAAVDLETARAAPGAPADATWYLALAYVEANDRTRAREELRRVAASEGPHRDEAGALLRRLGTEDPR